MIKASYNHWLELVFLLVRKEIKIRYKGSLLGYLWSMLNPLLMMTILSLVFSQVMRDNIPYYPLYVLSGVICWNMFSQSLSSGIHSIILHGFLLRKVSVPAWVFPTSYVFTSCLNMVLALLPFAVISFFKGYYLSWTALQLPLVIFLFVVFIEGVVISLSSLNVVFRDIAHVCEPLLQLFFYMSPVVYTLDLIPKKYQILIKLNPIYYYLDGFRHCLYFKKLLSFEQWLYMSLLSCISMYISLVIYKKVKNHFMYYI